MASPSLFAFAAFLVVIPEEPALSEAEWGICFPPNIFSYPVFVSPGSSGCHGARHILHTLPLFLRL
jgi:hypothetical protein